jgi:hypothetical protein
MCFQRRGNNPNNLLTRKHPSRSTRIKSGRTRFYPLGRDIHQNIVDLPRNEFRWDDMNATYSQRVLRRQCRDDTHPVHLLLTLCGGQGGYVVGGECFEVCLDSCAARGVGACN